MLFLIDVSLCVYSTSFHLCIYIYGYRNHTYLYLPVLLINAVSVITHTNSLLECVLHFLPSFLV